MRGVVFQDLPTPLQDEAHVVAGNTGGQMLTKSESGHSIHDQYLGPSVWRAAPSWSFHQFSKTFMNKDSQDKTGLEKTPPTSSFQL